MHNHQILKNELTTETEANMITELSDHCRVCNKAFAEIGPNLCSGCRLELVRAKEMALDCREFPEKDAADIYDETQK